MASTIRKQTINSKYIPPRRRIDNHTTLNKECIESMKLEIQEIKSQIETNTNTTLDTLNQNKQNIDKTVEECDNNVSIIEKILEKANNDKLEIEYKIQTTTGIIYSNNLYIQQIELYLVQSQNYLSSNPQPLSYDDRKYIMNLKTSINNAIYDKDMYIQLYMKNSNYVNKYQQILINIDIAIETYNNEIKNIILHKNKCIDFYEKLNIRKTRDDKKNTKSLKGQIDWLESLINILQLNSTTFRI